MIVYFRLNPVPLCAEMRQMYRAILVAPEDRQYQHIFWRFNADEPVMEYELKRLTFGFATANNIAPKCIKTLALSEKDKYPKASIALLEGVYIADIVSSGASIEAVCQLRE